MQHKDCQFAIQTFATMLQIRFLKLHIGHQSVTTRPSILFFCYAYKSNQVLKLYYIVQPAISSVVLSFVTSVIRIQVAW